MLSSRTNGYLQPSYPLRIFIKEHLKRELQTPKSHLTYKVIIFWSTWHLSSSKSTDDYTYTTHGFTIFYSIFLNLWIWIESDEDEKELRYVEGSLLDSINHQDLTSFFIKISNS